MEDELYLTPEGADKLREELEQLKGPRRNEIAARLRHAVSQGDLSENADYISAKEDQAFLEGRILELELLFKEATIVDREAPSGKVEVGATVVVQNETEAEETFHIVGEREADPRNGKISHKSPIGKSLMGKTIGDVVTAETPGGKLEFKILRLS
ncbi:MAG: transcription elongation factor GreA [Anaerolineales bacterium]